MQDNFRTLKILVSCLIFILVLSSLFEIRIVSANHIWEDDFEDEELDTWLITRGVFSAEQKTLWASGTEARTSNRAYHDCNVTVGRWSFDILLRKEWIWRYHPPSVRFMVNSTDDISWSGYVLDFYTLYRSSGSSLAVYLRVHSDTWSYLAHYEYTEPAHGWQKVGIQRSQSGRISVYLNNSRIINVVDNSLGDSNYFVFDAEDCVETVYDPLTHTDYLVEIKESPMLDNIVVSEILGPTDENVSSFVIVISVIGSGLALIIIGNDEIKRQRQKIPESEMLQ